MDTFPRPDSEFGRQAQSHLLDVLIRAALVGALVLLCYRVISPFLTMAAWSVILAVTLYPLHQGLARRVGRRQWLASTILVAVGVLLVVIPTALLLNSFADSVRDFVGAVQENRLSIPAPREGVERWPIVGRQLHDAWSKAHADLPGFVQGMQPKAGDLARSALSAVASVGGGLLLFMVSFVVAAVVMAYGESGARGSRALFRRIAGGARGEALARLSTATIRAVALGVVGVAFIQAVLIGLALLLVIPTSLLLNSFADSVSSLVKAVQENRLSIPAPREGVERWPVVGRQLHDAWSKAHADLPGFVQGMQPKAGDLARSALSAVASVGGGLLLF
ncbi:MAG: AI-2E family transporter, partial [Pyrinomonadaceae bacterium]